MWRVDESEFEDEPGYVTHQQGEQAVHSDGVRRDTQDGKTLYTLLFPKGVPMDRQLFVRVAELYTRGGNKHGLRNWEESRAEDTLEHHTEALWRHFMKFFFDIQDGEDHAAAIVWNVNAVDLTRQHLSQDAADEHTRLCEEIGENPFQDTYEYLAWSEGDRLTEYSKLCPGQETGSWLYGAGGDVWYFEESFGEPWAKGIDRSARSLKNLIKQFGPLTVTRGRNQGWVLNSDGSVQNHGSGSGT